MTEDYSSPLHEFIDRWIATTNTTWEWLFKKAGVANASSTLLRRGSIPRPDTLRKLADAMDMPRRKLFELAEYVRPEELEPEDIDIEDPELRLFFGGNEWDDLLPEEQQMIKDAIRMARRYKLLREERAEYQGGDQTQ